MPGKRTTGKPGKQRHAGLRVVSRAGTAVLYIRGNVRGQDVYESARTDDPVLAQEACAAREAEIYRSRLHGIEAKQRVTFAHAVVEYLQRPAEDREVSQQTRLGLGRIIEHFGKKITCDQIGQAEIDAAGRKLCRPGAKAVTVLRTVTTPVKAVLNYAHRRGWCDVPKFEAAKGGSKRTDWFRPAEAEALIEGAADHLKPLLVFLFCTGARLGEAIALDWSNVDLRFGRVILQGVADEDGGARTKNGRDRIVDLPPRAVAALANLPGAREGRVFLRPEREAREVVFQRDGSVTLGRHGPRIGSIARRGKAWEVRPGDAGTGEAHNTLALAKVAFRTALRAALPPVTMVPYRMTADSKWGGGGGQIRSPWAAAMRAAGIKRRMTPHHARHSWSTWSYCVHKDLVKLRIDGGWRTTAMCERYTKLAPDGLKAEIEAFWNGASAPPVKVAIARVA